MNDKPASMQTSPAMLSNLQAAVQLALAYAAVKLGIHIFANCVAPHLGQGFFRDELYFIDCGRRLALGYVDQAPMVALQARVGEILFGHSLVGLRLFSALAGSVTVFLTGILVWAFGGPLLAQAIAMTLILLSPFYLGVDGVLSITSFEPVFWMTIALTAILLARGASPRWWLVIGLACGLGIENKQDIVFFIAAFAIGLLLSPQRSLLFNRWMLGAIAITMAFALPNFIWQIQNHWPTWQFLHNPTRPRDHSSFLGFIRQQVLLFNITLLFWVAGALWLQFSKSVRLFRFLSLGFFVFFFLMFALHAKGYYLAPYYPILIAAGAVFWELSTRDRRWLLAAVFSLAVACDFVLIPIWFPLQKPVAYLRYRDTVMTKIPSKIIGPDYVQLLETWYADRFGWREMVKNVANAYNSLPPEERSKTAVLSQFYGDASAIDILGAKYGLPKAISGNQNFWLWGPRGYDGEYVLAVGFSRDEIPNVFSSVTQVGKVYSPYSMQYEHMPIFLCKHMNPPLQQYWPRLKHWR